MHQGTAPRGLARRSRSLVAAFVLTASGFTGPAAAQDLAGRASIELTGWVQAPLYPEQQRADVSLMLSPELAMEWAGQRLLVTPFVRWDRADPERTHWDVRELLWEYDAPGNWELRAGVGRVFWGVTEFQHLVDIINQTDFVENIDGEDKLGQPMVHVGLFRPWGTLDLFVLPGFRTRTFPGSGGRPQFPLPLRPDLAAFESSAGRGHLDVAARWSHVLGPADIGLAYFRGTSREPRFVVGNDAGTSPVLIPHYDQIDQASLDLSWVAGAWLWKLELLNRHSAAERFSALTGGIEYTLYGVAGGSADVGLLLDYAWDERGRFGQNPFNDDVFAGSRLALNDVSGTELLSGLGLDRRTGAGFVTVEGSRRLGSHWRAHLEVRGFFAVPPTDFLYPLRGDDSVRLELERFF